MNIEPNILAEDPDFLVCAYEYNPDSFAPLYQRILEKVAAYPLFGEHLAGHLARVGQDTQIFMQGIGYAPDIAHKVGHAFALHDIGKIMQDPELWRVTKEKRFLTATEQAERPKHADLGIIVLNDTLAETGISLDDDQKAHIRLVKYLMKCHHERLDGSGPQGLTAPSQGRILRLCAIIDTVDGKLKAKSLTDIFEDMSGAKHAGQFDESLVAAYADYYRASRQAAEATPVLANHAHSL